MAVPKASGPGRPPSDAGVRGRGRVAWSVSPPETRGGLTRARLLVSAPRAGPWCSLRTEPDGCWRRRRGGAWCPGAGAAAASELRAAADGRERSWPGRASSAPLPPWRGESGRAGPGGRGGRGRRGRPRLLGHLTPAVPICVPICIPAPWACVCGARAAEPRSSPGITGRPNCAILDLGRPGRARFLLRTF